ncbi:MAG: hypothetical protein WD926_01765 [Patescibacteria group bacterium]
MTEAEKLPFTELPVEERAQQIRHSLRRGTRDDIFEAVRLISLIPRRREPVPDADDPGFPNLFYRDWGEEYCLHDDLKLEAARAFFGKRLYDEAALQLANLAPSTYENNPGAIEYAVEGNPRETSLVLAKVVTMSQRYISWDGKLPEES